MNNRTLTLILCIVLMVLGMITCCVFLIEKVKKYSVKETLIKSMASFLFICTALVAWFGIPHENQFGLFIIAGLVCGMLGDIWLDLKYVYRNDDRPYTYAGFVAFAVGHVFYITGMFLTFGQGAHFLYIVLPIALGIAIGFANLLLEKPMKLKYGEFRMTCAIYGCFLFSMVLSALSLCIYTGFNMPTTIMIFGGGMLFAISDLVLSGTYFGEGKERPIDISINGILYYIAQFAIAFSLFFI